MMNSKNAWSGLNTILMSRMGRVKWRSGSINGMILVPCYENTDPDEVIRRARIHLMRRLPHLADLAKYEFIKLEKP